MTLSPNLLSIIIIITLLLQSQCFSPTHLLKHPHNSLPSIRISTSLPSIRISTSLPSSSLLSPSPPPPTSAIVVGSGIGGLTSSLGEVERGLLERRDNQCYDTNNASSARRFAPHRRSLLPLPPRQSSHPSTLDPSNS